jgi:hypothetical protein
MWRAYNKMTWLQLTSNCAHDVSVQGCQPMKNLTVLSRLIISRKLKLELITVSPLCRKNVRFAFSPFCGIIFGGFDLCSQRHHPIFICMLYPFTYSVE